MIKTKWIHCPVCGNKTRDKIREDTVLTKYVCKGKFFKRYQENDGKEISMINVSSQTVPKRELFCYGFDLLFIMECPPTMEAKATFPEVM